MAILWADFPSGQHGLYGTAIANAYDGVWSADNTGFGATFEISNDPDPLIGSDGYVFHVATFNLLTPVLRISNPNGAQATMGAGCRLWTSRLPASDPGGGAQIGFRTAANATIVVFQVQPDGSIVCMDGSSNVLGTTGTPVISPNSYNHLEAKVVRHASEGTAELRVNGIAKITATDLALGSSDISIVGFGCDRGSGGNENLVDNYYKDMVVWDGTGSEGNDFQGSVAVRDLLPDGDIDLNWTPSSGTTGWDLIDESPPVDTGYIQAGDPPPDPAKFSLTNLPDDVTSVRALIPIVRAVKTDGGDCNIQVGLTPNDTNWDDGADRPITTAYTYWWDVSHLSPATSAPWTPAEVNAAYVRVDRTL